MICSILIGIWGLNITVRSLGPFLPDYHILGKLLAIQLVLILCKLQPTIIHQIVRVVDFEEPGFPLSPKVYANGKTLSYTFLNTIFIDLYYLYSWHPSADPRRDAFSGSVGQFLVQSSRKTTNNNRRVIQ